MTRTIRYLFYIDRNDYYLNNNNLYDYIIERLRNNSYDLLFIRININKLNAITIIFTGTFLLRVYTFLKIESLAIILFAFGALSLYI